MILWVWSWCFEVDTLWQDVFERKSMLPKDRTRFKLKWYRIHSSQFRRTYTVFLWQVKNIHPHPSKRVQPWYDAFAKRKYSNPTNLSVGLRWAWHQTVTLERFLVSVVCRVKMLWQEMFLIRDSAASLDWETVTVWRFWCHLEHGRGLRRDLEWRYAICQTTRYTRITTSF